MEEEEQERLNKIETSVYQSAKTFDTAFKKSGGTMNSTRFKKRERSVDFNNPGGTR